MRIKSRTDKMTQEFLKLWKMAGESSSTSQKKIEFRVHEISNEAAIFVSKIKIIITDSIQNSIQFTMTESMKKPLKKKIGKKKTGCFDFLFGKKK